MKSMFENVPPNLPTSGEKVEDIFAPVETVKSSPPRGAEGPKEKPALRETPRMGFKRLLIIVGGVVVVVLGAWGAYGILRKGRAPQPEAPAPTAPAPAAEAPIPTPAPEAAPAPTPAEETPPPSVDSDGDGLPDEEEAALGTDPSLADSDNDGLTDREEARIYNSNPLNPDTDGDSYLDGQEVQNNYSPTGPGRLLPPVPTVPPGQ